jgi:hypothetical protein
MSYSGNFSFNLFASENANVIQDFLSEAFTADEVLQTSVKVPAGTAVGSAPVVVNLALVDPPKLIVLIPTAEVQGLFNAEIGERTFKKLFVYDGADINIINLGNTSIEDAFVKIIAFG